MQRSRFRSAKTEAAAASANGHAWQYGGYAYANYLAGVGNSVIDVGSGLLPNPLRVAGVSLPHISPIGPYKNSALIARDAGWVGGNVAMAASTASIGGGASAAGRLGGAGSGVSGLGSAAGSAPNLVYRGLAAGEDATAGLVARAPGATGVSPISHVAGRIQSPWISTTKSMEVAAGKYGGNGGVAIDLNKVTSEVVDVSGGFANGGRFSSWAIADQEVLIRGSVPPEAIVGKW